MEDEHVNRIELVGHYGGDLTHAAAAWASRGAAALTPEMVARVPDLLVNRLARQDPPHTSPFEHSLLHFRVTSDFPTHVHHLKHRTFGVNSESARYRELKDDRFYVPVDWPAEVRELAAIKMQSDFDTYHDLIGRLVAIGMSRGRAKESARFLLPLGMQYTYIVKCDFLNFVHYLQLRLHPAAQLEVRLLASEALAQVRALPGKPFEHSLAAFGYHDADYAFPASPGPVPDLTRTRVHDPVFRIDGE